MDKELQNKLWEEATIFIENSRTKYMINLDVTLDGVDNMYMELAFTCDCEDKSYIDFIDIIDEFLQLLRFEYSSVKIQEFSNEEIVLENKWEHIIQLSQGNSETEIYNKFRYSVIEHELFISGFYRSIEEIDAIYLQSLKEMARKLKITYQFDGNDKYEEMIVLERAMHNYFEGGE